MSEKSFTELRKSITKIEKQLAQPGLSQEQIKALYRKHEAAIKDLFDKQKACGIVA